MKDETILYDPAAVRFCALNSTAAFLWDRLDVPRSHGDLLRDLGEAYLITDRAKAELDLRAILGEFVALSFVSNTESNGETPPTSAADLPTQVSPAATRPTYGPPNLRVMDETEALAEFQITAAGISWWVM